MSALRLSILALWLPLALAAESGTVRYAYDAAGRLAVVDYGGGRAVELFYDPMGNLTQRVVAGVAPQADVSIAKTGVPAVFEAGRGNLVYWLTVSNAGPDSAANVRVSDPLPAATVFARASAGAVAAGVFEANLGALASGGASSVRLELVPLATGVYVNVASVTNDAQDSQAENNVAAFTNIVTRAADTNANGLADWWEILYFTNAADRVASGDYDHDGVPNDAEQAAGSDPTVSNAFLRVDDIRIPAASCRVSFPTASGRVYAVESSPVLPAESWSTLHSNIPGTGAAASHSETNPASRNHYRVRASVP